MHTGTAPVPAWPEDRDQPAAPAPRGQIRITPGVALLIVTIAAIVARWAVFGNPIVEIDEQFYLLVGDRLLHGAIPYVDIWDRKPVGLFLLFAGIRLLGGGGVWQYQICALFCVIGTAMLLFAMARRIAGAKAALGSALLYIFCLNLAGGQAGQAPVWYNLPVAGAIATIFFARTAERHRSGDFRWLGAAAMLLFGIAMQIKYNAMFEGLFAGLALIGMSHQRGRTLPALAVDVALWVGCALAPTVLAGAVYAVIGHFPEWLYANFTSIFSRGQEPHDTVRKRIVEMMALTVPLVLAIPLRRWTGATPNDPSVRDDLRFLDAWAASALLGVVLFGTWFNHYALPLYAPLAVTAAPLAGERGKRLYIAALSVGGEGRRRLAVKVGHLYFALLLLCSGIWGEHLVLSHMSIRGDASVLAAATAAAASHRNCIYVYDGLPALYYSTGSCLPTPHVFPSHIKGLSERGATGIDEVAEVSRIMAKRPDRVMTMEPSSAAENPAVRAVVYRALNPDYVVMYRRKGSGPRAYVVYGLKGTLPLNAAR